ncbi:hypothetical protein Pfo_025493 [Paulownia fortunei]|nr:hypothetical protein Pfo_025493 [Paulownia fortunei]
MKEKDGFISARPERMYRPLTTHSPNFLGLHKEMGFWKQSNFGKGVIIGVLDTGIFPSHPSFSGEGMPPPPAKWKGKCEFQATECNNKLIGAQSFNLAANASKLDAEPPLDDDGHGTHTASTAAGGFVQNASVLGNAYGTAVGMAPQAHLAIYKVCFGPDCPESDILAGLDAAVGDGVDVLSISLGEDSTPFFNDNIAIGSFAAVQKGIFVSCAGGNSGPSEQTITNEAPWILTVGASTIDRSIRATAKVGDGQEFDGETVFQPKDFPPTLLPLVYAGSNGKQDSAFCANGSLAGVDVKGKVVLCDRGGGIARLDKGQEVKNAGGAAMILANQQSDGFSTSADAHVLPATHVSYTAGLKIKAYINSTTSPMATILFKGTVIGDPLAPIVASFSSRGPSLATPGILKPDIIGPGVNILAAWPFPLVANTNSKLTFNIESGTSMSCPHLSGMAALLKSAHPYWSPAAIKSAFMTTADLVNVKGTAIVDQTLTPADIFATGAGHVNPSKANDPGLVYDIAVDDYIPYLCGLGYTEEQVGIIAHKTVHCTSKIPEGQLNYPSFSVALGSSQTFTRTVTNVGEPVSYYTVKIVAPQGVSISVQPDKLYFTRVNQKATYSVTFSRSSNMTDTYSQGYLLWVSTKHTKSSLETYIVHVEGPDGQLTTQSEDLESWYHSFLPATTASSNEGEARLIHSYHTVFKGFAARLSPDEVKDMEKKNGFISARPEKKLLLHTTHSPNFLGLNQNMGLWKESNYGKGVIIGVLDTGILPEHPSFSDEGMPPPPAKWKGKCEFNHTTCNNKIIGARYFSDGNDSPLDDDGHGTHTASTAAGNFVKGANLFGNANGTAVGIAPLAHLAIYRVCAPFCSESSILAGMDTAVEDGVDVLSISLGQLTNDFFQDFIALGAFSAMEKGILVSCSAGNYGPLNFSLANEAPWILTVGASTTDRKLRATAVLGNNQQFHGESAYQPKDFPSTLLPLVYAGMLNTSDPDAPFCSSESLNQSDVQGKIVLCELGGGITRIEKGEAVKSAGGAAMILVNNVRYANTTFAEAHVLPATHVSYADGLKIKGYINSTSTPMATILFEGTVIGDDHAPVVAAFSSRGPNFASRGILKPDILGPGVNILAAWPTSVENNTNTKSTFNIISGTSVSCPHLSGVAALLKSTHPDWSPAAIKSAIMTTANVVNLAQNPIEDERFLPASIFATGPGHVNPSRANDPGLVYDIQPKDYIPYLCGLNYTNREVGFFLQRKVNCSVESSIPEAQLNYPSFALTFTTQSTSQMYSRTVTNVGDPNSSYDVEIVPPPGIDVRVKPTTLNFSDLNQKMQYQVTFSRLASAANNTVVQGFLKWTSPKHSVRSPIAVILQ